MKPSVFRYRQSARPRVRVRPIVVKSAVIGLVLFFRTGALALAADREVITDETIRQVFKSSKQLEGSHSLMTEQKTRLEEMAHGFLDGDLKTVGRRASEINAALKDMPTSVPATEDAQALVWEALSSIKQDMLAVQEGVKNNDYKKAYNGYVKATYQCLQCHQATRSWGRLAEPELEKPTAK